MELRRVVLEMEREGEEVGRVVEEEVPLLPLREEDGKGEGEGVKGGDGVAGRVTLTVPDGEVFGEEEVEVDLEKELVTLPPPPPPPPPGCVVGVCPKEWVRVREEERVGELVLEGELEREGERVWESDTEGERLGWGEGEMVAMLREGERVVVVEGVRVVESRAERVLEEERVGEREGRRDTEREALAVKLGVETGEREEERVEEGRGDRVSHVE